ncbi:MAG TPA: RNA methyltransferase [Pyrinomonadaceae bacterium]|nr:RNA methyltransferase [Pyrinomonadaceae bacterium]
MEIRNRQSAMRITSRDNSLLRRARNVRDGKMDDLIFVEGMRLSEEALTSNLDIEVVIHSDRIAQKPRAARVIAQLGDRAKSSAAVNEKLLESISYTKTPQGIVLLARRPPSDVDNLTKRQPAKPLIVILHETNNPVNVGAIVRTAEAAGATGVIATANTADPFSPKALRGAMGSAFRLPVWSGETLTQALEWCRARKIQIVCADISAATVFSDVNWLKPSALLVGRESTGLSHEERGAADLAVRIPMKGSAESLNVAVATGVILYEAARQRAQN